MKKLAAVCLQFLREIYLILSAPKNCTQKYKKSFGHEKLKAQSTFDRDLVWKLHYFSVTQILREIKVVEFRVSKSPILTHFIQICVLIFMNFCTF